MFKVPSDHSPAQTRAPLSLTAMFRRLHLRHQALALQQRLTQLLRQRLRPQPLLPLLLRLRLRLQPRLRLRQHRRLHLRKVLFPGPAALTRHGILPVTGALSAGGPPGAVQTASFNGTFSNQPNVTLSRLVGTLHMTGSVAQNVTISSNAAAILTISGLGPAPVPAF